MSAAVTGQKRVPHPRELADQDFVTRFAKWRRHFLPARILQAVEFVDAGSTEDTDRRRRGGFAHPLLAFAATHFAGR
jgi:hypothetical protein